MKLLLFKFHIASSNGRSCWCCKSNLRREIPIWKFRPDSVYNNINFFLIILCWNWKYLHLNLKRCCRGSHNGSLLRNPRDHSLLPHRTARWWEIRIPPTPGIHHSIGGGNLEWIESHDRHHRTAATVKINNKWVRNFILSLNIQNRSQWPFPPCNNNPISCYDVIREVGIILYDFCRTNWVKLFWKDHW